MADTCAVYANDIFNNYGNYSGSVLLIGAIAFAFQIYCDFSGYSDIAVGSAKLFGIRLMRNFNYPYFARDIAEFWRRWHISLTTWFRDYIYIPLGGSRGTKWESARNTFIIFLVSGFWHGANWTFIAWGVYHAVLFMPLLLLGKNRKYTDTVASGSIFPSIKETLQMFVTFVLVLIGWIFFRAQSISDAIDYIVRLGNFNVSDVYRQSLPCERYAIEIMPIIALFLFIEWFSRRSEHPLVTGKWLYVRVFIVMTLLLMLGNFVGYQQFIYFMF